jgi:hypothetical protein
MLKTYDSDYWDFGLRPSSGTLKIREHILETGSLSVPG